MKAGLKTCLLVAFIFLFAGAAMATTSFQLQSTYLGDGLFEYQLNAFNDPFFVQSALVTAQTGFTNEDYPGPASVNWNQESYDNLYSTWGFSGSAPSAPYGVSWQIQGGQTSYKLVTNNFIGGTILQLSVMFSGIYPGISSGGGVFSQNILGCVSLPSLVPCSPDEAGSSPTNFVYTLRLAPDITINHLIQTNGQISGIDFNWSSAATFMLQGTSDFQNWTNVAVVWSYPPETAWTTNVSLNQFGSCFRLMLMSDGHVTNGASLNLGGTVSPNLPMQPALVNSCKMVGTNVAVNASITPGGGYLLQAMDSGFVVRQSIPFSSPTSSATVNFNPATLPNPVYFRVAFQ
jgi:hypothetical protein